MPKYVDGFVLPVPEANLGTYQKMARKACKIWMEYGALDYVETVGDHLEPEHITTTFPKLAKLKPGEVVVFSYIVYKSRAHRDKVIAQVMKDPRINEMCGDKNVPFNPKRMAYGGFRSIVQA